MTGQTSVASEQLYQSQWWTRLAEFTEKTEQQRPKQVSSGEGTTTSVGKTLASFFRGITPMKSGGLSNSSS